MKFFNNKAGLTLIELITSLAISAILFGVVIFFTTGNVKELSESNINMNIMTDIINFDNFLTEINSSNYKEVQIIPYTHNSSYTGSTNPNPNNVLILKNSTENEGIILGIVDKNTLKIQTNYVYGDNFIGYRDLSPSEILEIKNTPSSVFNKEFALDKIFPSLRAKDFKALPYNNGDLTELSFNIIKTFDKDIYGTDFANLHIEDLIIKEYNLIY